MSMIMGCGCISYPCIHHPQGGLGQLQTNQSLYYEMFMKSGMQNMQQVVNPKEYEKKPNKKLLLLRK